MSFQKRVRRIFPIALLGLVLVAADAGASPPMVFHSPNDDGVDPGGTVTIPSGTPFTLHLYLDSGPVASLLEACAIGEGDEVCGWDLAFEGQAGLGLQGFTPSAAAQSVLAGNLLRTNGGDPLLGTLGPVKIGDLVVDGPQGASLDLRASQAVSASLELETISSASIVVLPEPGVATGFAFGALALFWGARRRSRARRAACALVLITTATVGAGGARAAELVVNVAETDRFFGEDNVYGEGYGRFAAVDEAGTVLVTAGVTDLLVWNQVGGVWLFDESIPVIGLTSARDIALDGEWVAIAQKPELGLENGTVTLLRDTGSGYQTHVILPTPPATVTGYRVDLFGLAVELEGTTLLVGAPDSRLFPGSFDGPGFVFEYTWDGSSWNLTDHYSDTEDEREFGTSIDLEGDRAIIGAPRSPGAVGTRGAAYLYTRSGGAFSQEAELLSIVTPDATGFDDRWGMKVAADTENAFVAAGNEQLSHVTVGGPFPPGVARDDLLIPGWMPDDTGRSVVIKSATTTSPTILLRDDSDLVSFAHPTPGGPIAEVGVTPIPSGGRGLAMTTSQAFVGDPSSGEAGPGAGQTLVYDIVGGVLPPVLQTALVFGDAETGDNFGTSIAARNLGQGDVSVLVGAPGDRRGADLTGATYRFDLDPGTGEWTKARELPLAVAGDAAYGFSVAASDDGVTAVGAPFHESGGQVMGGVWIEPAGMTSLPVMPVSPDTSFGTSAATDGSFVLVGAPAETGTASQSGVVHVLVFGQLLERWAILQSLTGANGLGATPPSSFAGLGSAVAVEDGWLMGGAPADTRDGLDAGAAFLWRDAGGSPAFFARLEHADVSAGDAFGEAVAVVGEWAFVGAPGEDQAATDAGAVYVYRFDGVLWNHVETLLPANAQVGQHFGETLEVDPVNLFVGSTLRDDGGTADAGATYAYRLLGSTWQSIGAPVLHLAPAASDLAGRGVAFAAGKLFSGIEGDDGGATDAGSVAVFDYDARLEVPAPMCPFDFVSDFSQDFVSPNDPTASDSMGERVSLAGDTLAVAERFAPVTYFSPGAGMQVTERRGNVHLYRRTDVAEWILEESVLPPLAELQASPPIGNFGASIALAGELLVVGNNNGQTVHVFERASTGWVQRGTLAPGDDTGASFGRDSVAIAPNGTVVVGAVGHSGSAFGAGAIYVFERTGPQSWVLAAGPLFASDPIPGNKFGMDVAIDAAGSVVVATPDKSDPGFRNAYVFESVGGIWQETDKLLGDPFGASTFFGKSGLDVDAGVVAVGDRAGAHSDGTNSGVAFVWTHDGASWGSPDVIEDDPALNRTSDNFGQAIAVEAGRVAVGAPGAGLDPPPAPARPGVVTVFEPDASGAWRQRVRLGPMDGTVTQFGETVALAAGIVTGGSPFGTSTTVNVRDGMAEAFDLVCDDADLDGLTDDADNCPFAANPNQLDANGDGNGDACQCGDTDVDHFVATPDADLLSQALAAGGGAIGATGQALCSVVGPVDAGDIDANGLRDDCNIADWVVLRRLAAAANVPGDPQVCSLAVP